MYIYIYIYIYGDCEILAHLRITNVNQSKICYTNLKTNSSMISYSFLLV